MNEIIIKRCVAEVTVSVIGIYSGFFERSEVEDGNG
jgi:hypothetical protein